MPLLTAHLSISLDGFVAGPEQSEQNPIGVGGMALHHWHLDEHKSDADQRMTDRILAPRALSGRGCSVKSWTRSCSAISPSCGGGERLFDDVAGLRAEPIEVVASPVATHVVYRIGRT
jgi:hypothetical protein